MATALHIIAAGRIGRSAEAELVTRYSTRIAWPFQISEVSDNKPFPVPQRDAARPIMALDETGSLASSAELAGWLNDWQEHGMQEIRFLIGGADGLPDAARAVADRTLALGRMTWPHLLARAMLTEQLYRALTILAGHPYHRA